MDNDIFELMTFFGLNFLSDKDWSEFLAFWIPLTPVEKLYYRAVQL